MNYFSLMDQYPKLFSNKNAQLQIITDIAVINEWSEKKRKELKRNGQPESWGEIGIVYEDPFIVVLRDLVKFPSGRLGSYFRIINAADLQGGQGSVVLPVVNDKILLIHIYRHPTRSWHWEVPRGFGEPNLSAAENAQKEILEEIEGEIQELIDLGPYYNNTGAEGNRVRLFYAKLTSAGRTNQDEGIERLNYVSIGKMEQMVRDAEITDGFTIAAFTRARLKGLV